MRKVEIVTVPAFGGRDDGKVFQVTEMPAIAAEKWAWKMFIAVKGTSGHVPEDLAKFGMVAVAIQGINAFLSADVDFAKLEPLLDEMMTCVRVMRDKSKPDIVLPLLPADIDEPQTIGWLRSEVLRVHTNFSLVDGLSGLITIMMKATPQASSTASTSPPQSPQ